MIRLFGALILTAGLLVACQFPAGTYHPKLLMVQASVEKNPQLTTFRTAVIDEGTHVATFDFPSTQDLTKIVLRFSYEGNSLTSGAKVPVSNETAWDLSTDQSMTISGYDHTSLEYHFAVTPTAPLADKKILSVTLTPSGNNSWDAIADAGDGDDMYYFTNFSSTSETIRLVPNPIYVDTPPPSLSNLRLDLTTSGRPTIAEDAGTVYEQYLWNTNGSNWESAEVYGDPRYEFQIDLTKPVPILLTAEDGSTRTVTLSVEGYE